MLMKLTRFSSSMSAMVEGSLRFGHCHNLDHVSSKVMASVGVHKLTALASILEAEEFIRIAKRCTVLYGHIVIPELTWRDSSAAGGIGEAALVVKWDRCGAGSRRDRGG